MNNEPIKISPTKHSYKGYDIIKNGNGSKYIVKQGRKTINKSGFLTISDAVSFIDKL